MNWRRRAFDTAMVLLCALAYAGALAMAWRLWGAFIRYHAGAGCP